MIVRRKKTRANSGETLVEVMVSAVICLMMLAVLQTSISFCSSALRKSQQIREDNAEICQLLQTAVVSGGSTSATYSFVPTSSDGSVTGSNVLFTLDVELSEKNVTHEGTTVSFPVFTGTGGPP